MIIGAMCNQKAIAGVLWTLLLHRSHVEAKEAEWGGDIRDTCLLTRQVFEIGWPVYLHRPIAVLSPKEQYKTISFARWCSGSTQDFGSCDPGSNPGRAATQVTL